MNNDVLAGGKPSTGFLSHFTGTAQEAHLLCSLSEKQPAREGGGAAVSKAKAASATIKAARRGHPRVPSPLRQRNSKRHEAEPGKQRPSIMASTSRNITLEAVYQPCMSAADVRMAWSRYSGDAEGKGAPSH